jgi:arylsulfatase A-like enzyme
MNAGFRSAAAFTLWLAWIAVPLVVLAERPNFILAMADDQGWGDMGYSGDPVLKTPTFDEMARIALRFNRFYAAAPSDRFPGHSAWLDCDWKLHRIEDKQGTVTWQLYDLAADAQEMKDLLSAEPKRAATMQRELNAWLMSVVGTCRRRTALAHCASAPFVAGKQPHRSAEQGRTEQYRQTPTASHSSLRRDVRCLQAISSNDVSVNPPA